MKSTCENTGELKNSKIGVLAVAARLDLLGDIEGINPILGPSTRARRRQPAFVRAFRDAAGCHAKNNA